MSKHTCRLVLAMALILLASSTVACTKPAPAEFSLTSLYIVPKEVVAGEAATVSAQVENIGGTEGTYTVTLSVDGAEIQSKVIKLASKTTETVSFTLTRDKPGSYNVEINNLSGTFRVLKLAEFTFSNLLITPSIAEVDQAITLTADVSNAGEVEGRCPVTLIINGDKVETKELTVSPGATEKVSFAFAKDAAGIYSIEVGSLSGLVIVSKMGSIMAQFEVAYPELYQELLKLPDLKELEVKDNEAIEDIIYLALNPKYRAAFESMLSEGIKDKRKYCTPLQALLWIAYDGKIDGDNLLQDYSLRRLMKDAWRNTTTSKNFTSERWQDFGKVIDRLNSPRLVSIYMADNIAYDYEEAQSIPHRFATPEETFLRKKGICNEQARFALYCLLNNGYDYDDFETKENTACMLGIDIDTLQGHDVCLFREGNVFYTIDNGRLRGPFPDLIAAVDSTAARVNITAWKKYFFRDVRLSTTKIVRAEEITRLPAETKGKNIIVDGIIDEWPLNAAMVSDPAGDTSSEAKDKRGER